MTEQEKSQEPQNPYYDREKAQAAVIATNAVITDEQFQSLIQAIGKTVVMQYHVLEWYSDEDSSSRYTDHTPFVLKDFNFIIDPKTNKKYLAFLRAEKNTFFPSLHYISYWEDQRHVTVENVKDNTTGELLWSFDTPNLPLAIDQRASGDYVKAIMNFSISAVRSRPEND